MLKGRVKRNYKFDLRRGWPLYLFLLLPLVYLILFRYLPMYGVTLAFRQYHLGTDLFSPINQWVGLKIFEEVFKTPGFSQAVFNTLFLNLLDIIFSFPAPILLALLLNELRFRRFKRVSQTLLYLPYFLSWAIIGGIVYQVFSTQVGLVNTVVKSLGAKPISFLFDPASWVFVYILMGIWQTAGWGTILYLAAISGINMELYDAARVDGAGRLRSMWHITLPGIRPTIAILFIMAMGRIIYIGFDRPYILSNPLVLQSADVISTFVYRVGLKAGRFSVASAVGVFQAIINLFFLVTSNALIKKFGEQGIW
jgi:putative aldouronate transport system permease protein